MTREEHLEWCKERAREYLAQGDVVNGIASMLSDLNKHDEFREISEMTLLRGHRGNLGCSVYFFSCIWRSGLFSRETNPSMHPPRAETKHAVLKTDQL